MICEADGRHMDDESEMMLPPETAASHLAVGMYMALWPKIEKCDGYVGMLLDTQESLQEKIAELMGLLDGGADTTSPLVGYAARLQQFPSRVQALQTKLEGIRALLASLRKPDVVIPEPPKAAPPVVVAAIDDEEDEREALAPAHNVATEDVAPQ